MKHYTLNELKWTGEITLSGGTITARTSHGMYSMYKHGEKYCLVLPADGGNRKATDTPYGSLEHAKLKAWEDHKEIVLRDLTPVN